MFRFPNRWLQSPAEISVSIPRLRALWVFVWPPAIPFGILRVLVLRITATFAGLRNPPDPNRSHSSSTTGGRREVTHHPPLKSDLVETGNDQRRERKAAEWGKECELTKSEGNPNLGLGISSARLHYKSYSHFRRPPLFSAARGGPPKITHYFRRSNTAAESSAIFGGQETSRRK